MNVLKVIKLAVLTIFLLDLTSSFAYAVTLSSLNGTQFRQAFIDKTVISVATDNLNGRTINNTFAMFMDTKGNIYGKMSHKPDNEPQTDKGTYSVKQDGTFYITWEHWDGGQKLCGRIFDTKNAYISVDCNNVFHTVFMKAAIESGNVLN